MNDLTGYIHSIDTFGAADGPGVRFIIFLQGCRLRCRFCHNPDTWDCGRIPGQLTAGELIRQALRYRPYWGKDGGITVSGGEPLLQIDFLLELFSLAKENGISTVLDTAGEPFCTDETFLQKMSRLMDLTDLVLLDLKEMDNSAHKKLTGKGNENILAFARWLDTIGKPVWIRHVLVPGWTDEEGSLLEMREFLDTLHNVQRVEVLPYHTLGVPKWEALGIPYSLKDVQPPTDEEIRHAQKILGAYRQA